MSQIGKFDEYKLFVENTQKLSERRQKANEVMLAINSATFTILAFLVKDSGFASWRLFFFSLPLFFVGILICCLWQRIIAQFKVLIGWRYEQLRKMEAQMPDSYRLITKEWDEGYDPQGGDERFGFARLEVWVPRLILALYVLSLIGSIIATATQ